MPLTSWLYAQIAKAGSTFRFRAGNASLGLYLSTLLIFFASRAAVIVGLFLGKLLMRAPIPWQTEAGDAWYDRLLRWDSAWYLNIVEHGYRYDSDPARTSSVAFFPLYPLVSVFVKSLFGVSGAVALLLVANVAAAVLVVLMTRLAKDQLGDEAARLSLALFCFSPTSLFLSAGYSESLCLVFILLSLIMLSQQRFVSASAMVALSLGTRSVGIVMIPVIILEIWRQNKLPFGWMLFRMLVCISVAASSLLMFMIYLNVNFGNPFAFAAAQSGWNKGSFLQRFISAIALEPFVHSKLRSDIWFFCILALTLLSFWRLRTSLALYALGTLALPYFTLGITGSQNRFTLMCFPAFMCLATLCDGRAWLAFCILGMFGALLLGATALYSQWYWVG